MKPNDLVREIAVVNRQDVFGKTIFITIEDMTDRESCHVKTWFIGGDLYSRGIEIKKVLETLRDFCSEQLEQLDYSIEE